MGLFSHLASGLRAESMSATGDRGWTGGGYLGGAGRVTAETVACAGAVLPIVSVVAETIGSLPLEFKAVDGAADAGVFPLADTFAYQPNPLQTGAEFWTTVAFNAVLRGRSYVEPVAWSPTEVELWQLRPNQLVERHSERAFGIDYWYDDGRGRHFGAGDLFTVSGLSPDGVGAVVPWQVAKSTIELANLLDAFGHQFFRNGARPSGVLSTDQKLSPEAIARLKEEFNGNFAGVLNAGKVPVLEQSLKYLAITASNTDSQYLEIKRNQRRELAANWRVPLFMIGEGDDGKTDEQKAQGFVKYTIRPLARRIEQAIARDLMTPEQRAQWKPSFNMDALLRGDSATQWRNAVLARTASIASRNQLAVGWFGLPRIEEPWADDPREPLNSNRAADTTDGGMTSPQDRSDA